MKLIFCPLCGDIRKLSYKTMTCECRRSWGYYEADGLHAVIGGPAIPLGIHNASFRAARNTDQVLAEQGAEQPLGVWFEAFIIPRTAPTVRREQ